MAIGTQALRQKVPVRIVPPAMVTSVPESTAAIRRRVCNRDLCQMLTLPSLLRSCFFAWLPGPLELSGFDVQARLQNLSCRCKRTSRLTCATCFLRVQDSERHCTRLKADLCFTKAARLGTDATSRMPKNGEAQDRNRQLIN